MSSEHDELFRAGMLVQNDFLQLARMSSATNTNRCMEIHTAEESRYDGGFVPIRVLLLRCRSDGCCCCCWMRRWTRAAFAQTSLRWSPLVNSEQSSLWAKHQKLLLGVLCCWSLANNRGSQSCSGRQLRQAETNKRIEYQYGRQRRQGAFHFFKCSSSHPLSS